MGDPFSQIPVRFLGHGFGHAESIKWRFSQDLVDCCGATAVGYVFFHCLYSGMNSGPLAMLDTFCFDTIASCALPSVLCFHTSRIAYNILKEFSDCPRFIYSVGPMLAGICSLMWTYELIDNFTNQLLDATIRSALKSN